MRLGSISAGRKWSSELAERFTAEVRSAPVDLLVVENFQFAPYAHGLDARLRVLDLPNIDSDLAASYAQTKGRVVGLPFRLESAALRRLERKAVADFDVVCVVTEQDRARLPSGAVEVLVCPNGWTPDAPLAASTEPVAVFVALLGWPPNADAARWLAIDVWPRVRAQHRDARLLLVGRDPLPALRALVAPGVEVVGTVPDVRPYLAQALVALAPLRSGGGSRLKVLEAMSAGRPVVATPKGAEGQEDLVGDGLILAGDEVALAQEISRLFADPAAAARLGERARHAVATRYDWDVTLAPLLSLIDSRLPAR
jgi:glycosyltransferase involved in cell wall biosynthesis